jgi:hypothetical protein
MPELIFVSCKYFTSLIQYIKQYFERHCVTCLEIDVIDPYNTSMHIIFDIRDRAYLPLNFMVYNFEQLEASNLSDEFYSKLTFAKHIFDYSENNITFLNTMGIDATFMPYSWFPSLRNVKDHLLMKDRICSFMFIGYFNERRRTILMPIHENAKNKKQKMFIGSDLWGINYTGQSTITKIALNIHCYNNNTILEVHRIITCILDKNIVLTERSSDKYYDELLDGCVTWIDESNAAQVINDTLYNDKINLDVLVQERLRLMLTKMEMFSNILDKHREIIIKQLI